MRAFGRRIDLSCLGIEFLGIPGNNFPRHMFCERLVDGLKSRNVTKYAWELTFLCLIDIGYSREYCVIFQKYP